MSVYQEEWREVFIISAEVYIFGALVYIILAKGERQWWTGGKERDTSLKQETAPIVNTVAINSNNIQS